MCNQQSDRIRKGSFSLIPTRSRLAFDFDFLCGNFVPKLELDGLDLFISLDRHDDELMSDCQYISWKN
jgi:hypothetical protein